MYATTADCRFGIVRNRVHTKLFDKCIDGAMVGLILCTADVSYMIRIIHDTPYFVHHVCWRTPTETTPAFVFTLGRARLYEPHTTTSKASIHRVESVPSQKHPEVRENTKQQNSDESESRQRASSSQNDENFAHLIRWPAMPYSQYNRVGQQYSTTNHHC